MIGPLFHILKSVFARRWEEKGSSRPSYLGSGEARNISKPCKPTLRHSSKQSQKGCSAELPLHQYRFAISILEKRAWSPERVQLLAQQSQRLQNTWRDQTVTLSHTPQSDEQTLREGEESSGGFPTAVFHSSQQTPLPQTWHCTLDKSRGCVHYTTGFRPTHLEVINPLGFAILGQRSRKAPFCRTALGDQDLLSWAQVASPLSSSLAMQNEG